MQTGLGHGADCVELGAGTNIDATLTSAHRWLQLTINSAINTETDRQTDRQREREREREREICLRTAPIHARILFANKSLCSGLGHSGW